MIGKIGNLYLENGKLVYHKTWFKVLLNPILRILQFWTNRPYVIISRIDREVVLGYGISRMKLVD